MDLKHARTAAKKVLERLYEGTCVVFGYRSAPNGETGETEQTEIVLYTGACRLSKTAALYRRSANRTESAEELSYDALLYLPPEAAVGAGCRVTVTQGGVTTRFQQAGDPAVYGTHQEIKVRRVGRA